MISAVLCKTSYKMKGLLCLKYIVSPLKLYYSSFKFRSAVDIMHYTRLHRLTCAAYILTIPLVFKTLFEVCKVHSIYELAWSYAFPSSTTILNIYLCNDNHIF